MKIDRIKAEKVFRDYVSAYNAQDDKVRLKIEHTFRVAVLCEKIAASLGMQKTSGIWPGLPGCCMTWGGLSS